MTPPGGLGIPAQSWGAGQAFSFCVCSGICWKMELCVVDGGARGKDSQMSCAWWVLWLSSP